MIDAPVHNGNPMKENSSLSAFQGLIQFQKQVHGQNQWRQWLPHSCLYWWGSARLSWFRFHPVEENCDSRSHCVELKLQSICKSSVQNYQRYPQLLCALFRVQSVSTFASMYSTILQTQTKCLSLSWWSGNINYYTVTLKVLHTDVQKCNANGLYDMCNVSERDFEGLNSSRYGNKRNSR